VTLFGAYNMCIIDNMYIYSAPKRYPDESMTVRRTLCVSVGQLHQTKHTHTHTHASAYVHTYYIMDVRMQTLHTARTTELGRRRRV
jgi:hypothetical protein